MKNTLLFSFFITSVGLNITSFSQPPFSSKLHDNGLRFTENKGQIADMSGKVRPDVLYKGDGGGADICLRKTGISYVYSNRKDLKRETSDEGKTGSVSNPQSEMLKLHRVDMDFMNCNSNIYVSNEDAFEGYNNYYFAHCPKGVTHVKQYNKVIYKNIYNGVDAAFYGSREKGLEFDIIINPYADIHKVKLNWTGAEAVHINNAGNLVIKTSVNEFYVSIPKAYQEINGERVFINAGYSLTNNPIVNSQIVTFKIGNYNPAFPLIIDPLTWITYFGGSEEDLGLGVTTDRQHNVIFCGYTESPDLPVSVGAYDVVLGGFSDGWIAKFTSNGARLWATYFGGSAKDECRQGIAVDTNNNIFVTSVTWSTDFPTKPWGGAFMQLVNNSTVNGTAYIAQFTPAGTLTWSTYYGGSTNDWGLSLAIDALQDIIITGWTSSADFPLQAAYQPVKSGGQDAFIVKFNNLGVRQWATFYGGSNTESGTGITTDGGNNIYITGTTSSNNFPVVAAYQNAYGGGANDAFLVKLNAANGNPVWSTYYGGTGDDQGTGVAADALGNIFLGLKTSSANNISTAGSYQSALKGNYDGGIIKFTNAGSRVWGTYIGGNQSDGISGLAIDMNNNISIAGSTQSANFPVTACAFEKTYGGSGDMFMAKINQQGQLLCSTFINNCGAFSIAVDGAYAYINGGTGGNLPVTAGAFQTVYGGNAGPGDAAFIKLCSYSCDTTNGVSTTATFAAAPASPCSGASVNFTLTNTSCDTANTTYSWTFAGGTPATSPAQSPNGIIWSTSGAYAVSVQITSPCDSEVTITNNLVVSSGFTIAQSPVICAGNSVTVGIHTYSTSGTYTDTLTAAGGCDSIVTTNLTVSAFLPTITPGGPTTFCYGGNVILSASGGNSYLWSNGDTIQSITVFTSGNYFVTVTDSGCSGTSETIKVNVNPTPPTPGIIVHQDTLYCSTDPSYSFYQWYDDTTLVSGATDTFFVYMHDGNYNVKVTDENGCLIAAGIDILTAISKIGANDYISLFPDPVSDQLYIISGQISGKSIITIYNGFGDRIYTKESNSKKETINCKLFSSGIYFVQVSNENNKWQGKFVKE